MFQDVGNGEKRLWNRLAESKTDKKTLGIIKKEKAFLLSLLISPSIVSLSASNRKRANTSLPPGLRERQGLSLW